MRGVLWDLDGTLVDSEEYHWLSWVSALRPVGIELTRDQFLASFGQKNDRILRNWLGPEASADRIRRIGDAKEQTRGLTALQGAREWLIALKRAGWKQAIASSAPRLNVKVMLDVLKFDALLDAIVAAEDVTHGKPDPEVFLTAAERLGVPPARSVVVEDAAAGIEAARRARMKSIGVNPRSALGADVDVNSLADLPADGFERLIPA